MKEDYKSGFVGIYNETKAEILKLLTIVNGYNYK